MLHDFHTGLSGGVTDARRPLRLLAQVKHQGAELAERAVTLAEVSFPVPEGVQPTLLARLVRLTLAFEKLLARSPERAPLTSDQALRLLAARRGGATTRGSSRCSAARWASSRRGRSCC